MVKFRDAKQYISEHAYPIGLGLLIVLSLVLNLVWIRTDGGMGPEQDSKIYLSNTLDFMDRLKVNNSEGLLTNLQDMSVGGRPPLYQLLSIPFFAVLGRSMDSGLMLNLVFQVLLLVSVFNLGKILSGARAGLLAALLVSVYPPQIQLLHIFRPYLAMTACITFSLWLLARLLKDRQIKTAWVFILSLGLGSLIHPFFMLTLLFPVFVFLTYLLFFQVQPRKPSNFKDIISWLRIKFSDRLILYAFLPGLIIIGAIAAGWYLSSGMGLLNTLVTVNSDELALYRGYDVFTKGFVDIPADFFWYLRTMPAAISNILTGLFALGFINALVKRRPQDWFLVISFAGAYVYFGQSNTMTWMQFSGLLPIIALISSIWLAETKTKRLSVALIPITLTTALFVFYFVNWGSSEQDFMFARGLAAPLYTDNSCQSTDLVFCAQAPKTENWRVSEFLSMVEDDEDCDKADCRLGVIPISGYFTFSEFRAYLEIDFPDSNLIISSSYFNGFGINGFDYPTLLSSSHLIFKGESPIEDPTSTTFSIVAQNFLNSPPPSFAASHKKIAVLELPGGIKAILMKRITPLTLQEAEDAIQAIKLPEKYTTMQYEVLAPLYLEAGYLEKALTAYEKVVEYNPNKAYFWFRLALVNDKLGKTDAAALAYRQVLSLLPPDDPFSIKSQTWLNEHPPKSENWRVSEFLSMVEDDEDCGKDICRLGVIPISDYFTFSLFRTYLENDFPDSNLLISGSYFNGFGIKGFDYPTLLSSSHLIFKGESPIEDPTSTTFSIVAQNFLNSPPPSFAASHKKIAVLELPGGIKAILMKRITPLTLQEAEEAIQVIHLPEKYTTMQYEFLAPLYLEAGYPEKALTAYEKAVEINPEIAGLWFRLASVYDQLDQPGNAARAYRQVLSMLPPDTYLAQRSQTWLNKHPDE